MLQNQIVYDFVVLSRRNSSYSTSFCYIGTRNRQTDGYNCCVPYLSELKKVLVEQGDRFGAPANETPKTEVTYHGMCVAIEIPIHEYAEKDINRATPVVTRATNMQFHPEARSDLVAFYEKDLDTCMYVYSLWCACIYVYFFYFFYFSCRD